MKTVYTVSIYRGCEYTVYGYNGRWTGSQIIDYLVGDMLGCDIPQDTQVYESESIALDAFAEACSTARTYADPIDHGDAILIYDYIRLMAEHLDDNGDYDQADLIDEFAADEN